MITAVVNTATYIPFTLLDANGDPVTGKVNADFIKTAYLASTPATTATPTVTEQASGRYVLSVTPTAVGIWHVTWSVDVDGETVRYEDTVQVITAAQADPAQALSASEVSVVSPVASSGDVTLYQGDDYDNDDSRALDWSTTDSGTWPTLTSATISFVARAKLKTAETITASGSVVTGTGATKQVRVELTDTQTAALDQGDYTYQVIATLSSGNVVTLTAGDMTVPRRLP